MNTASNRSTALPKLWQSFSLSPMWGKQQITAMESQDGKFCEYSDGDWTAKVHPPNPLTPKFLTQTQFNIWAAKLQEWLASDDT